MSLWLVLVSLALAVLPAVMTIANLRALKRPPRPAGRPAVAILIPARNEEAAIGPCVEAALASVGADVEVVVLDDELLQLASTATRQAKPPVAAANTRPRR